MIERSQQTNFAQEAVGKALVRHQVGKENLHGLYPVGNNVADFIDFAHATKAKDGEDFVIAYVLTNGKFSCHGSLQETRKLSSNITNGQAGSRKDNTLDNAFK